MSSPNACHSHNTDDLLAASQVALPSDRLRQARIFLEVVGAVQEGASDEVIMAVPTAKLSIGAPTWIKSSDIVKVAAGENLCLRQASFIENTSNLSGRSARITAV